VLGTEVSQPVVVRDEDFQKYQNLEVSYHSEIIDYRSGNFSVAVLVV